MATRDDVAELRRQIGHGAPTAGRRVARMVLAAAIGIGPLALAAVLAGRFGIAR